MGQAALVALAGSCYLSHGTASCRTVQPCIALPLHLKPKSFSRRANDAHRKASEVPRGSVPNRCPRCPGSHWLTLAPYTSLRLTCIRQASSVVACSHESQLSKAYYLLAHFSAMGCGTSKSATTVTGTRPGEPHVDSIKSVHAGIDVQASSRSESRAAALHVGNDSAEPDAGNGANADDNQQENATAPDANPIAAEEPDARLQRTLECKVWAGSSTDGSLLFPERDDLDLAIGGLASRPSLAICLSGGGFRAATLSLGWLRALEELGVLRQAQYLCCCSGGL